VKTILGILLIGFGLLFFLPGILGLIFGIITGLFGLVAGLVAAVVSVVASIFGAMVGLVAWITEGLIIAALIVGGIYLLAQAQNRPRRSPSQPN